MFKPRSGQPDLWDLSTDYYLHHTKTTELPSKEQTYRCGIYIIIIITNNYTFTHSYTKWWSEKVITTLPLPFDEG